MKTKTTFLLLPCGFAAAFWFSARTANRLACTADHDAVRKQTTASQPSSPATAPASLASTGANARRDEPSAALPLSADVPDEGEELARSISQLNVADVRGCLQEFQPEELRGNLGRLLVRRWANSSPADAARWTTQLTDPVAREELSAAVALAWAERDLAAALAWAQSLTAGSVHDRVLTDLGYELARIDPLAALRLAATLPATAARDALSLHALRQAAAQDSDAIREWAAALPPGAFREQALAAVAISIPDGPAAARLVADLMVPGLERDRALIGVVQRWAQVDYDRTAAWVAAFPPAQLKETAVQILATFEPSRAPHAGSIR